jgi:hypothetical protein
MLSQASGMQPYIDMFKRLHAARAVEFRMRHGLQIKSGEWLGAAVLKLLKPSWTTDPPEPLLNSNGIFFGIWIDASCVAEQRMRYNIHAKRLRFIKGPSFPAREFARSFRIAAHGELKAWPNITYPKGPITLFEGDVPLNLSTLESDASALMDRFVTLTPLVDDQLAAV